MRKFLSPILALSLLAAPSVAAAWTWMSGGTTIASSVAMTATLRSMPTAMLTFASTFLVPT